MFGSFRHNKKNGQTTEFVERQDQSRDCLHGHISHAACDYCRAKKIKCDGQRPTCSRCRPTARECTYTQANRGRKAQQKTRKPTTPTRSSTLEQHSRTDNPQVPWEDISDNVFLNDTNLDFSPTLSATDHLERTSTLQHYGRDELQNISLYHRSATVSSIHFDELPSQHFGSSHETGVETLPSLSEGFDMLQQSSTALAGSSVGRNNTPPSSMHSDHRDTLLADFFDDDIEIEDDNINNVAALGPPTPAFTATSTLVSAEIEPISSSSMLPKYRKAWDSIISVPTKPKVHTRQHSNSERNLQTSISTVCNCSRSVMTLLEQVDQQVQDTQDHQPDTLVSLQAQTIKKLMSLTECNKCAMKAEYRMLLFMVCRQMIYHMERTLNELLSTSDPSDISHGDDSLLWHVSIGSCHSQGRQEWTMIMCSLVIVHLKRVAKTLVRLQDLRDTGSQAIESTVFSMLEQKINRMMRTLHQQIDEQ